MKLKLIMLPGKLLIPIETIDKMKDSLTLAIDKQNIIELINQFGMSIDLRDWSSFCGLFTDSVEFDYSSIGEVTSVLQPGEITNTARQDLGGFQATQHAISNHIVKLADNDATCFAHVRAQHFLPNEQFDPMLEIGGYYHAKLISQNSSWKIKSWKFTILWSIGSLELFELAKKISR